VCREEVKDGGEVRRTWENTKHSWSRKRRTKNRGAGVNGKHVKDRSRGGKKKGKIKRSEEEGGT